MGAYKPEEPSDKTWKEPDAPPQFTFTPLEPTPARRDTEPTEREKELSKVFRDIISDGLEKGLRASKDSKASKPAGMPAHPTQKDPKPQHPWPISVVEREWPKVKAAPLAFSSCVFVGLVLGCIGTWFLYQTFIIPGKDATIEALREGPRATPEQEKEIKELKAKIETLQSDNAVRTAREWPALTPQQIDEWCLVLGPFHINSIEVFSEPSGTADAFFQSVRKVGKRLGVPVTKGIGEADIPGIEYIVPTNFSLGPVLEKLLRSMGDFEVKPAVHVNPQPKLDIMLFMGDKALLKE